MDTLPKVTLEHQKINVNQNSERKAEVYHLIYSE